jgi:SOS-response transcriptional repressor LexA
MAGKKQLRETIEVRRPIGYTGSEWKKLNTGKPSGVPLATFVKSAALEKVDSLSHPQPAENPKIRVLGYIPGGPALEVRPLPDHTMASPPFKVKPDCYALLVVGDSMESSEGVSIPDGSYAVFCPEREAFFGSIVHAEWEDKEGVRLCTVKRYNPQPDGSVIFEPLNKKHKPIKRQRNEYVIRGIFLRPWKDIQEDDGA